MSFIGQDIHVPNAKCMSKHTSKTDQHISFSCLKSIRSSSSPAFEEREGKRRADASEFHMLRGTDMPSLTIKRLHAVPKSWKQTFTACEHLKDGHQIMLTGTRPATQHIKHKAQTIVHSRGGDHCGAS